MIAENNGSRVAMDPLRGRSRGSWRDSSDAALLPSGIAPDSNGVPPEFRLPPNWLLSQALAANNKKPFLTVQLNGSPGSQLLPAVPAQHRDPSASETRLPSQNSQDIPIVARLTPPDLKLSQRLLGNTLPQSPFPPNHGVPSAPFNTGSIESATSLASRPNLRRQRTPSPQRFGTARLSTPPIDQLARSRSPQRFGVPGGPLATMSLGDAKPIIAPGKVQRCMIALSSAMVPAASPAHFSQIAGPPQERRRALSRQASCDVLGSSARSVASVASARSQSPQRFGVPGSAPTMQASEAPGQPIIIAAGMRTAPTRVQGFATIASPAYTSAPSGHIGSSLLPATVGQVAIPCSSHLPHPMATCGVIPFGVTMRGASPAPVLQLAVTPCVTPSLPTRVISANLAKDVLPATPPTFVAAREAHDKLLSAAAAKIKQLALVASKVEPAGPNGCSPLLAVASPSPGDAAGGGNRLQLDTTQPPSSARAATVAAFVVGASFGAADAETRASLENTLSVETLQHESDLDQTQWISEYNLLHAELEESEKQAKEERALREQEFESLQSQLQSLQARLGASVTASSPGLIERSPISVARPVLQTDRDCENGKYLEQGRQDLHQTDQASHAKEVIAQKDGGQSVAFSPGFDANADACNEPGLDILRKNLRDAMDWMDRLKNQQDLGADTAASRAVAKRPADAGAGIPTPGGAVAGPPGAGGVVNAPPPSWLQSDAAADSVSVSLGDMSVQRLPLPS